MGNRRKGRFDDRSDADQLCVPVEGEMTGKSLLRGKVNKYPKDDFYKIVDTYREQEIMEIHGYCEAEYECIRERALAAKDLFMYEYTSYVNFCEAMSDGYYCSEDLAQMAKIEDELMRYAQSLRKRRLDALNLKNKGVEE